MENTNNVTISLERFEELISLEQRVSVVVERIFHNNYITTEDLLWIIGTETAVEIAQEIRDKEEKSRAERERREMEKGKVSYD